MEGNHAVSREVGEVDRAQTDEEATGKSEGQRRSGGNNWVLAKGFSLCYHKKETLLNYYRSLLW